MIVITIGATFMTTYYSYYISRALSSYIGWIQFPWRLLTISAFGLSFLAAGIFFPKKIGKLSFLLIVLALIIPFYNSKFFLKDTIKKSEYNNKLLSPSYVEQAIAYKVSEYLPITANYKQWLKYEPKVNGINLVDKTLTDGIFIHALDKSKIVIVKNNFFDKIAQTDSRKVLVNVHYLPYWKIFINNKEVYPNKFDLLGRPIIQLSGNTTIRIIYMQTDIEKFGNLTTIISLFALLVVVNNKFLWTKILNK